jgi:molybdenum cofactor guanylyltransferase
MNEGLEALLTMIGRNAIIICESNSLRLVAEPGVFIMVKSRRSDRYKQSAEDVKHLADRTVSFDAVGFDIDPDEIKLIDGKWILRLPATAIILAGGHSERMGRDKSLLPIDGRPMIEHVYRQLEPHFRRILVSASDPDKYAFLGLEVIPDKMPDQGPLMGIASALEASDNDLNLVVACDIPEIDIGFVQDMFRQADGFDAVVPVGEGSLAEPLFAVYRKSVLGSALEALSAGKRRVRDVFDRCRVKFVDLPEKPWLKNLNTPEEYEQALRDRNA